jgi:hypothetical protein
MAVSQVMQVTQVMAASQASADSDSPSTQAWALAVEDTLSAAAVVDMVAAVNQKLNE